MLNAFTFECTLASGQPGFQSYFKCIDILKPNITTLFLYILICMFNSPVNVYLCPLSVFWLLIILIRLKWNGEKKYYGAFYGNLYATV